MCQLADVFRGGGHYDEARHDRASKEVIHETGPAYAQVM